VTQRGSQAREIAELSREYASPMSAHDEASPKEIAEAIDDAIAKCASLPGALLPILHAIQDRLGFVPPAAVPKIADALNLSQAEVHGVIGFYHDFRHAPPGRHVMKLCRAEACQSMACEALVARLKEKEGVVFRETTKDGALTLEPVYCLGNCALAPALMLDGKLHGRITPEKLDALVRTTKEGAS
jgi:formate dehydrogenase subunit gamma